jgi:selenocysteine lyase/cysteine desulfurase
MGLPCRETIRDMQTALFAWADGTATYADWETVMEQCREQFAVRHECDSALVGLVPSITTVAATVAWSLAPRGGTVLVHKDEFRSPSLAFASILGMNRITICDGPYRTTTFLRHLSTDVAAVIVSTVSSADGARPDLAELYRATQANGTVLVVDATQSEGIVGTGIPWASEGVAVMCAGYKGLLGPRGTGYAIADPVLTALGPIAPSPYGMADAEVRGSYGVPGRAWPGARGLDQSPAWLPWIGALPGLRLLNQAPGGKVEHHVLELTSKLTTFCQGLGLMPQDTDLNSPVVSLPVRPGLEAELASELAERSIRAAIRLGRLRCGFHIYNTCADLEALELFISGKALRFFERT